MIWGSFFAGAVGMLFILLILMWLIPERDRKNNELFHQEQREDIHLLHNFWEQANDLARDRNALARERNGFLQKIVVDRIS